VLIDFYGTISAGDRAAVERTCDRVVEAYELPVTPQTLAIRWGEAFFELIETSNRDGFRTLYECELASLRSTLGEFGIDSDPSSLLLELEEYWASPPVYPDARGFLDELNLPVCCVSNADTRPLCAAIEKHNLPFDAVMTSEAAQCYKPHSEIFRRAMDVLGVKPERAIHIGDSLHSDVGGASKLGLATVWLRRDDRIHDIGTCHPEFICDSLNGIWSILGL
jgi:2-haloacid dehalogenase/putative hydrolase of the HAD superfamily